MGDTASSWYEYRDEVLITFQNLQLAANLSHVLLNINVEIKIFIDADTKKLHCIGNIDDSACH